VTQQIISDSAPTKGRNKATKIDLLRPRHRQEKLLRTGTVINDVAKKGYFGGKMDFV
jgi:hypothetical protein